MRRLFPPPDWVSWSEIAAAAADVITECPWFRGKQRSVGHGGGNNVGTHSMIRLEVLGREPSPDLGEDVGGSGGVQRGWAELVNGTQASPRDVLPFR